MPRGDRRGPDGEGQMEGRGLGYCIDNDQPGFTANMPPQRAGRGARFGKRCGRDLRNCYGRDFAYGKGAAVNYVSETENKEVKNLVLRRLKNLANNLENELEILKNKLNNFKSE